MVDANALVDARDGGNKGTSGRSSGGCNCIGCTRISRGAPGVVGASALTSARALLCALMGENALAGASASAGRGLVAIAHSLLRPQSYGEST